MSETNPLAAWPTPPDASKKIPDIVEDGSIRISADSNLVAIGDANLFDHGWLNESESKDAYVVDVFIDPLKLDPSNRAQRTTAQEQVDLVAKRIPSTVRREQFSDGTWRLHVVDGNQAGTIKNNIMENIRDGSLMVKCEMHHYDQSRNQLLDACREKGWGTVHAKSRHRQLEFLGLAVSDPLRFTVTRDGRTGKIKSVTFYAG